jgi:hypothetical protein
MKRTKTKHAPDPIFPVIERHRQKFARVAEQHDEEKIARADALVLDQEYLLATTMPTTMAGVVALVEYVAKNETDGGYHQFACVRRVRGFRGQTPPEWSRVFHRTLARALSKIAA